MRSRCSEFINAKSLSRFSLLVIVFTAQCIGVGLGRSADNSIVCALTLRFELVLLSVNVSDIGGHPLTNLSHADFVVFDKDETQQIAFFSDENSPQSIAIIVDRSRSARKAPSGWLSSVCRGVLSFKEESNVLNEYFIIGARDTPEVVTNWTRDSNLIIDGLSRLAFMNPQDTSALYDACHLALEKFKERKTVSSAILLISDGQDSSSQLSYQNIRRSLKESATQVYAICPGNGKGSRASQGRNLLKSLSVTSGGTAHFPTTAPGATDALSRVAVNLRHQYLIGYYPTDTKRDGRWHSIKVVVTFPTDDPPGETPFEVRTRAGYYAPKEVKSSEPSGSSSLN